jgi:hypothetical protein
MSDTINPDHYKHGGIETIEYIKAKMSPVEYYGYLKAMLLNTLAEKV